ncbi:MAG: amidohydrolase [Chitinophagales bacterium]|nr:amidohydrolase [Chitinophagales bacterium]
MDIVFFNAKILTQDQRQPHASAMLLRQDRIVAVGDLPDVLAFTSSETASIDLRGLAVVPGFIDAHIHVWKVGSLLTHQLDVRGTRSLDDLLQALAEYGRQHPGRPWLVARGFNEALWPDNRLPDRKDLDRVISNRPVVVMRTCAHQLVANTAALQAAGITAWTRPPFGGQIVFGQDGQPNGRLTETAMNLVLSHMPPYSEHDYQVMTEAAQRHLLQNGITAATDPAVMPDLLEVYRSLCRQGRLQLRLQAIAVRLPDGQQQALPLPERMDEPFLQINSVKFFADGAISGRTAALYRPYPGTDERGSLRLQPESFLELADEAQQAGFRIATHAIGDEAMDLVCHTYEQLWNRYRQSGNRVEHVGLPSSDNLHFMHEAGVFAVMQPIFLYELGKNFRSYLDEERCRRLYPLRSVWDAGITLALSTDAPVVQSVHPMDNLRAAVTRCDAEGFVIGTKEALSPEEALYAYTMGSAQANQTERFNGSIAAGKWADLVILSDNPLKLNPDTEVVATLVGGVVRYLHSDQRYQWLIHQLEAL